jgi:hypothetical protein
MRNAIRDPVDILATLIAEMALHECAFLDALWFERHPTRCDALIKRRHKQFMMELTAYYSCVYEVFLEGRYGISTDRFMDLVADQVAQAATLDPFIARPPFFRSDTREHRSSRYASRITQLRSKSAASGWPIDSLAARTALELREIIRGEADSLIELSEIERKLAQRLEWTARELTG